MYEEEHIFGPLTLRQTSVVLFGAAALWYVITSGTGHRVALIVLIVAAAGTALWKLAPRHIDNPEQYFRQNPQKLLQKIAAIQSQIAEREAKGRSEDPVLQAALRNLQTLREQLDGSAPDLSRSRN